MEGSYVTSLLLATVASAALRLARVRGCTDQLEARSEDVVRTIGALVRDARNGLDLDSLDDDDLMTTVYQMGLDLGRQVIDSLKEGLC